MKKSSGKLAPGRLATLKEIICERCKKLFTKNSPTQRYCGSKVRKIGCSYEAWKEKCRIGGLANANADPITMAEVNDETLYAPYFKDHCVCCGTDISPTWQNYKLRGNYCVGCGARANKQAKLNY